MFAILLGSIAPVISQLAQAQRAGGWVEVCSTAGSKWVDADGARSGDPSPAVRAAHVLDHCPTSLNGNAVGVLPAGLTWRVPATLGFEVPRLFLAAPRNLYAWSSAQPRGPPLLR